MLRCRPRCRPRCRSALPLSSTPLGPTRATVCQLSTWHVRHVKCACPRHTFIFHCKFRTAKCFEYAGRSPEYSHGIVCFSSKRAKCSLPARAARERGRLAEQAAAPHTAAAATAARVGVAHGRSRGGVGGGPTARGGASLTACAGAASERKFYHIFIGRRAEITCVVWRGGGEELHEGAAAGLDAGREQAAR